MFILLRPMPHVFSELSLFMFILHMPHSLFIIFVIFFFFFFFFFFMNGNTERAKCALSLVCIP